MPQKVYLDDQGNAVGAGPAPAPAPAAAPVYLDDKGEPVGGAKPEERSLGGFLSNIASSGGGFIKSTGSGLLSLAGLAKDAVQSTVDPDKRNEMVQRTGQMIEHAPEILSAAGSALKNRYGGLEQIKNTLYTDPVGVVGDVSTLAGGVGLGAKVGGAGKLARLAEGVSEATNPMRAITGPLSAVTHEAGNAIVRGTLRPPAAVRNDFGGSREIANNVLKDRVFSEASAQRKLTGSVADADKMLADAQAAGAPGVPRMDVARSVVGGPKDTAKLRARLGAPDATPELTDTAKAILRSNPKEIPLTDAQSMKREAQTLAFEAGADNNSIKKAAEKAKAGALRSGIEARVPEVGPVNERSQRLLGSQKAFAAAEDRPRSLTNTLSVLGSGAGAATLGPFGAVLTPLLIKAMDSPRVGSMVGIGADSIGALMNAPPSLKAALIARLANGGQE